MKPRSTRKLIVPLFLILLLLSPGKAYWQDTQASQEIALLLSDYRSTRSLPSLSGDLALRQAALLRAEELEQTGLLTHTRPGGRSFHTALTESGASFTFAGENLGYYKSSASAPPSASLWMSGWASSPDHAQNLSEPRFTRSETVILCRAAGGSYEYFAVQLFAGD